jgi:CDP-diacylglycerol pyrophosphatase
MCIDSLVRKALEKRLEVDQKLMAERWRKISKQLKDKNYAERRNKTN